MRWEAGWSGSARRCESPNFGARPAGAQIDLVLIHSISLPPGRYGGDAIERLFTNRLDFGAHPFFETHISFVQLLVKDHIVESDREPAVEQFDQ